MNTNFYSQKFIRCEYNYNTPVNRHCKYQDFESEMIDTTFGKVCLPCYHVICLGQKKQEMIAEQLVHY